MTKILAHDGQNNIATIETTVASCEREKLVLEFNTGYDPFDRTGQWCIHNQSRRRQRRWHRTEVCYTSIHPAVPSIVTNAHTG